MLSSVTATVDDSREEGREAPRDIYKVPGPRSREHRFHSAGARPKPHRNIIMSKLLRGPRDQAKPHEEKKEEKKSWSGGGDSGYILCLSKREAP